MNKTKIFIYDPLVTEQMIKNIFPKYTICNGYIFIDNYEHVTNKLTILPKNNNLIHYGKLVEYSTNIETIIDNMIRLEYISKDHEVRNIYVDKFGSGISKANIILNKNI